MSNITYKKRTNVVKEIAVPAKIKTGKNITGDGDTIPVKLVDHIDLQAVTASFSGDGSNLNNLKVGEPTNSTFSDGLFTDINSNTPISNAIDKINEFLKGIAPKQSPDLSNLESAGITGTAMKLFFGNSNPVGGYENSPNIDSGGVFGLNNGVGGSKIKLGVLSIKQDIVFILNNHVSADGGEFINYSAKSHNISTDGIGEYRLEVNGNTVKIASLTDLYGINDVFNLSTAKTGSFSNTGLPFELYKHRTGTVTIPQNSWKNGYNYAKVIHVSSLGENLTNIVEWVYDPSAINGLDDYNFVNSSIENLSLSGEKTLSGVKYYTSLNYNFKTTIENFYKNSYSQNSNGGVNFSFLSNGLTPSIVEISNPTNDGSLSINNLHNLGLVRVLGSDLGSKIIINNGIGKTGELEQRLGTVLYDNIDSNSSYIMEDFCSEQFRLQHGEYNQQSDVANIFVSSQELSENDLAVYDGKLLYPNKIFNNGDIENSSIEYKLENQPNYSNASGDRYFYRVFKNTSGSKPSIKLKITKNNSSIIQFNADSILSDNNINIWIKIPGITGWRDIIKSAPSPGTYVANADNIGCLEGDEQINGNISSYRINFITETLLNNIYYVLKIKASSAWAGYITKIEIEE